MLRRLAAALADAAESIVAAMPGAGDAAAQARTLGETAHRPWPLPDRNWLQGQTWCDLLFAHWPVAPELLRPAVPRQLPLDTFDGSCWIGVTPFEVRGLRLRGTPPLPYLSRFLETNVRTYVTIDGKPGIWFLSLDATSRAAVEGARRAYRLPYFRARAQIERAGGDIRYRTERIGQEASLSLRYRATAPVAPPAAGSLEHFLTERYCLYTVDEDLAVHRADIHHPPPGRCRRPLRTSSATR